MSLHRITLLIFFIPLSLCNANPQDPQVVAGQASFSNQAAELAITASDKTIIHWKDFSIDQHEVTRFIQPNAKSVVLNRVVGTLPSNIMGLLEANGKVFLVNPNGILIGESGSIHTGAFVASTLDFSNHDFLEKSELLFKGNSTGWIVNLGTIQAWDGDVALLAQHVDHQGVVHAPKGAALLASGHEILLKPTQERIYIRPRLSIATEGVSSSGEISALQVELKAEGNPYGYAINHSGNIETLKIEGRNGKVLLVAENGKIRHTGTISSQGQEVRIKGSQIELGDGQAKSNIQVQSSHSSDISIQAVDDLSVEQGFLTFLENGELLLESERGDVSIYGQVKLQGAGHVYVHAGQDVKIGNGSQSSPSKIESLSGGATISAGRDILLTSSDTKAAQISAHGNISLRAERDGSLTAGHETSARAFIFSKSNLSFVTGRHIKLQAPGSAYAGIGASKDVTIVVDNLYPTPPLTGPGGLFMTSNTRLQGETLRIFASKQSNNSIDGSLNLVSFFPGAEYSTSAEEVWGSYFFNTSGGVPFTIFYKDVWVSTRVTELFNTVMYEFLQNLKDFDDFYYIQRRFWKRYDRQGYERLRERDELQGHDTPSDRCYRMLRKTFKNSAGQLGELF